MINRPISLNSMSNGFTNVDPNFLIEVTDEFGNHWSIATHTEDVPPEEMEKRVLLLLQIH